MHPCIHPSTLNFILSNHSSFLHPYPILSSFVFIPSLIHPSITSLIHFFFHPSLHQFRNLCSFHLPFCIVVCCFCLFLFVVYFVFVIVYFVCLCFFVLFVAIVLYCCLFWRYFSCYVCIVFLSYHSSSNDYLLLISLVIIIIFLI